jgi:predicted secreted Zn-dependent protease
MQSRRFRREVVALAAALFLLVAHDSGVSQARANAPLFDSFVHLPLVITTAQQPTSQPIAIDNATMLFYTVEGSTEDEIRAYMNSVRPGEYDALTEWQFQWFVPSDGNGSCNLDGVTIDYKISVKFPQWTPPADAPAELVNKWNGYINALAQHEAGHVQRVVPYVPDLINDIKASSCDSYNETAQAWLNAIDQSNATYDAETGHGATQGATFP